MRTSTSIAWSESAFACDANKQKSDTAISRRHRGVGGFLNVVGNLSGLTKIDRVLPIRATVFSVGGGGSPTGDRRLRPHYNRATVETLTAPPTPESNAAVDQLVVTLIAARFAGKRPRPVADPWSKESWSVCRPACARTAWKAARAKGSSCARHPVRENSARRLCRSDNWHEWQLQLYRRLARNWIGRVRHF